MPIKRIAEEPLSSFLTLLWDLGLRRRAQCAHGCRVRPEAEQDITVVTTMMESRILFGSQKLFEAMQACRAHLTGYGPARNFFEAKLREQHARHLRYDDTAYNLEPNVKGSPGWLARHSDDHLGHTRHFGTSKLSELVDHGFLTPGNCASAATGP